MKSLNWIPGFCLLLAGCATDSNNQFRDDDRASRLMTMAGAEAGQIDSMKDRLTRQLNIAYLQTAQSYKSGALQTLNHARETLRSAGKEKLDNQALISGWISITELSNRAGDLEAAKSACHEAIRELKNIKPIEDRTQYVRGVATQLMILEGKPNAAALLREAGPWAKSIDDKQQRREAFSSIAYDLFLCDDYDGGLVVLRNDPDPTWRTDVLSSLAKDATPFIKFGRDVSFSSNYMMKFSK